ncbi:MAG: hypothetical protein K9N49_07175 [Candidatus Marinimicrobia bacterium]|nr:hypothetical protein [Candidatus Neomarinimicrobiota bacterium]
MNPGEQAAPQPAPLKNRPPSRPLDIGERRALAAVGVPPRAAWRAVMLFFVLGALLNGQALHEGALRRPYNVWWKAWAAGTRPLARAAEITRLNGLRAWIEKHAQPIGNPE